jgi:hypothetical protein
MKVVTADESRAQMSGFVRMSMALAWTVLILMLTLLPGEKGSIVGRTSAFFGGTDLSDAMGHVVLFGVLSLLSYRAARIGLSPRAALLLTLAVALALGAVSELLQIYVPERGATLIDIAANWLGVMGFALWARFFGPGLT